MIITKWNLLESLICWTHKHRNHVEMASKWVFYSPNVFLIGIHDDAADSAGVDDAFVMIDLVPTYLLMHLMFQVYP